MYAVVECGSHSTRLLLSTGSSDICRLSLDTHLGAALQQPWASPSRPDQQQQTATAAATLAAVRDYQQLIDQHQQHLRGGIAAVATAAVRETPEGPSIAAAVGAILQCPVRILTGGLAAASALSCPAAGQDPVGRPRSWTSGLPLQMQSSALLFVLTASATLILRVFAALASGASLLSQPQAPGGHCVVAVAAGDEEARLAFKGATCGLDSSSSGGGMCGRLCLVVDMGGRSTELAIGEHQHMQHGPVLGSGGAAAVLPRVGVL